MAPSHFQLSIRKTVAAVFLILGLALISWRASAQQPVVEMHVGTPPRPAKVVGRQRLVYELHVANISDAPMELTALDVLDAKGKPCLHLEQKALSTRTDMKSGNSVLAAHAHAVVYLTVDCGVTAPTAIQHRLAVKQAGVPSVIAGARASIVATHVPVLAPPLRGGPWVAVYSDEWPRGHRRVFYETGGHARLPGRFAIDWMKVGAHGRTLKDDSGLASSSLSYGAEVLAVADARVVAARDGITEAEKIADNHAHPHPDAAGNFISLALEGGQFATYEHLRPGSLKVVKGDHVRAGQIIAEVGFTGDSTEPHLHFHVSDSPSPLEGEGMPYSLSRILLLGRFKNWNDFGSRRWQDFQPRVVDGEFPQSGDVVDFK
jgi:murein DD-endopeptidase MepM/ murein hydrolase activator NlpD